MNEKLTTEQVDYLRQCYIDRTRAQIDGFDFGWILGWDINTAAVREPPHWIVVRTDAGEFVLNDARGYDGLWWVSGWEPA